MGDPISRLLKKLKTLHDFLQTWNMDSFGFLDSEIHNAFVDLDAIHLEIFGDL